MLKRNSGGDKCFLFDSWKVPCGEGERDRLPPHRSQHYASRLGLHSQLDVSWRQTFCGFAVNIHMGSSYGLLSTAAHRSLSIMVG